MSESAYRAGKLILLAVFGFGWLAVAVAALRIAENWAENGRYTQVNFQSNYSPDSMRRHLSVDKMDTRTGAVEKAADD